MTTTFVRKPKRVRTAYAHFVQDHYRRVSLSLNTNVPRAIFKALAEEWRRMSRDNKIHYYNLASFDRERYRIERDEWMKLHGGEPPKSRRRKKDPKAPKRKRSSFIFYAKDAQYQVRLEKPHLNRQERVREVVLRWRALPDEDKEKYREMAQNDKTRYKQELQSYRTTQEALLAEIQRMEAKNLARRQANHLARQQANQQPPQQEAEPVPQPQAPHPAAPEQPQPQVAQPQQQAAPVQPQPQEVEPQQPAVAPIQPQRQDIPQLNPLQNRNP